MKRTISTTSRSGLVAVWLTFALAGILPPIHAANVVLWDSVSSSPGTLSSRAEWKAVPGDILALEADPSKASSDPGYYGREYAFKGDAIVENRHYVALFDSSRGRVSIRLKDSSPAADASGREFIEFMPFGSTEENAKITSCDIISNGGDDLALRVTFSANAKASASAVFAFDRSQIIEVKPAGGLDRCTLAGSIEYGIAPSFIGDDLILAPSDFPSSPTVAVPADSLLLGLMNGGRDELVMTWAKGRQHTKLQLANEPTGKRIIRSIDFENGGQSLYIAGLTGADIWHREPLASSFLEKDVAIGWKRPFSARWKTELYEGDTRTSYAFRPQKGQIWRGVPGSYIYPVWFNGEDASFHLSKKVPPRGDAIIYFLEGQDTPPSVSTPVEIMKAALGRQAADAIIDLEGRKLRTHHRRGGNGVRRACTCGCTEAIQAVFETGDELGKKPYVEECVDDMIFFVQKHMARIDEYRRFADDLIAFLHARRDASPALKPYLESMEQIVRQIPQEYDVQKENMRSIDHASLLKTQTLSLASTKGTNNLKSYMELLKAWRAMGGAQDYVVAQCHTITRKLFQEAGYQGADQPGAAAVAMDIRARCRQVLRNPDGYEIWADY